MADVSVDVLYTNTNAIRSAVGVDAADIENEMIVDQGMELQMSIALAKFNPTHATDMLDPTKLPSLQLWCMWFGALRLAESPTAIAKKYGTGKDEWERFDIDWEVLKETARKNMAALQEDITPSVASGFAMMGKATPAYNPIVGP